MLIVKENPEVFWREKNTEGFLGKESVELLWMAVGLMLKENHEVFLGKESMGMF